MNEENERICVELNEEDVQEIVDCYEKDIKYIKQLEQRIDKAIELLKALDEDTLSNMQLSLEIIGHIEYILKGGNNE